MRIIAGAAKGRKLCGPGGGGRKPLIRPTADRAREALFSILGPEVIGSLVLDLFAGTGALGLEALSRGATDAVFVDNNTKALEIIAKNIDLCGFADKAKLLPRDLGRGLNFLRRYSSGKGFDLVFLDPPYGQSLALQTLAGLHSTELIKPGGLVVAEDRQDEDLPDRVGGLHLFDRRRYGDTAFWLYRNEEAGGKDEQL